MHPSASRQIILLKQEKVAALLDNDGTIAKMGPYEIDTKPHGHGDVHTLLHSSGLTAKWNSEGRKFVLFFQDTNALCFMTAVASIGYSARERLEVNSICVPRMAGEAVGAIARLEHVDGSSITCNVEYNQLAPLLKCVVRALPCRCVSSTCSCVVPSRFSCCVVRHSPRGCSGQPLAPATSTTRQDTHHSPATSTSSCFPFRSTPPCWSEPRVCCSARGFWHRCRDIHSPAAPQAWLSSS
jgi:hypothetical protein